MKALEAIQEGLRRAGHAFRLAEKEDDEPEEIGDDEKMNAHLLELVSGPHYENGLRPLLERGIGQLDAMMEQVFESEKVNRLLGERKSLKNLLDELDSLKES